ncbi:hypothetical protein GCM10018780_39870 [Streptomyces lanatus]|nr:hypothetical protein GCM10018780_39870 [Streptomyces lanatus]
MLVRVRLALRLDGEQEAAFLAGRVHPEQTVHPALEWSDLGEISVQGLDRGVLGKADARPRQKPGEKSGVRTEDPMQRFMG